MCLHSGVSDNSRKGSHCFLRLYFTSSSPPRQPMPTPEIVECGRGDGKGEAGQKILPLYRKFIPNKIRHFCLLCLPDTSAKFLARGLSKTISDPKVMSTSTRPPIAPGGWPHEWQSRQVWQRYSSRWNSQQRDSRNILWLMWKRKPRSIRCWKEDQVKCPINMVVTSPSSIGNVLVSSWVLPREGKVSCFLVLSC